VAAAILILGIPAPAGAQEAPHVVVVGEVQGASNTVTSLLQHLQLIDDDAQWSGGDTVLIQTGDLMDKGEHVREALDLFMRLQEEAAAAGGRVVVLMGNHEVLNILGELRDVNYMTYQTFAGQDAEKRQVEYYEQYVAWRTERAQATSTTFTADENFKTEWLAAHPPGWVEYMESMRPEGVYGKWLRTLPVAAIIDDVLFVHAGISPEMNGTTIEQMNQQAAEEIATFDAGREFMVAEGLALPLSTAREMVEVVNQEIAFVNNIPERKRTRRNKRVDTGLKIQHLGRWGTWSVLAENGPLWFCGPAKWNEEEHRDEMAEILDNLGVERLVSGQPDGPDHLIRARFDDRVVLTSVDMSDDQWAGGGNPAALDIQDGSFSVVTLQGREALIGE
jgi:calcineurin-like phosphoesterase family protein